jgi:hypothetical protein
MAVRARARVGTATSMTATAVMAGRAQLWLSSRLLQIFLLPSDKSLDDAGESSPYKASPISLSSE